MKNKHVYDDLKVQVNKATS